MSRDQNAGQSHNTQTDSSSFQRVKEFKYLGTTLTNLFYPGRNKEKTEVRECLLSFTAEAFVFQFAIQKFKN